MTRPVHIILTAALLATSLPTCGRTFGKLTHFVDTEIPLNYHFPEVIITGRGSVVKQIGSNKFAGLSMVFNFTNIGNEEKLAIHHMKWLVRMYFGIRL